MTLKQNDKEVLSSANKLATASTEQIAAAYYLAAIIDGEGCVSITASPACRVLIYNTDWDIIKATVDALETLNIHYCLTKKPPQTERCKHGWNIALSTKLGFEQLWDWVPLQSTQKLIKLLVARHRISPNKCADYREQAANTI